MKTLKILILLLATVTLFSCNKEEEIPCAEPENYSKELAYEAMLENYINVFPTTPIGVNSWQVEDIIGSMKIQENESGKALNMIAFVGEAFDEEHSSYLFSAFIEGTNQNQTFIHFYKIDELSKCNFGFRDELFQYVEFEDLSGNTWNMLVTHGMEYADFSLVKK